MGLLQFPPNPSPGDQYSVPNGPKYEWDGDKWVCIGGGGGGGGGGGLNPIPNDTVLGNVSGAEQIPNPLTGSQVTALLTPFDATDQGVVLPPGAADPGTNVLLSSGAWGDATSVVGIYPTVQPGLVPGAGAAPLNAALQADGTWRLPGQGVTYVAGPPYTVLPTDDWVFLNAVSSTSTITLPDPALVPEGKKIRLTIFSFNLGNALTINSAGINNIYWYGSKVFWPQSNLTLTGGTTGAVSYQLLFMQRGTYWWVTNEGFPINEGAFAMAGLLPGPPAGTATNAALQADMTWRVPGTRLTRTGSNYTILPTDEWVCSYGGNQITDAVFTPITWTLPPFTSMVEGQKIRLTVLWLDVGASLTLATTGNAFWFGDYVATVPGPITFTPTATTRVDLMLTARGNTGWILNNLGAPITFTQGVSPTPYPLGGVIPGPPPGTPATAVLHADMTWY